MRACIGCNAPCCRDLIITVTAFDVLRAAKASELPPETFAELRPLDLLYYNPKEVVVALEGGEEGHYVLAFRSHPCFFYDERKGCTIYKSAPLACRLYPYNSEGRLTGSLCPLKNKLLHFLKPPSQALLKAYEEERRTYWGIVEKVNRQRLQRERAFHELLKLAENWKERG